MNKQKIYLKADAGADIGYGHFVRTLALASMLRDDFDCTFYTREPSIYQITEMEKVCKWKGLGTVSTQSEFLDQLSGDEIVILDNYNNDLSYQKSIKEKGCKLVCIDDVHQYPFCADVVLCPDPCSIGDYKLDSNTQFYAGIEWSLLRKPFIDNAGSHKAQKLNDIVISMGGADPYCLTQRIVTILLSNTIYNVKAIIGDKTIFTIEDPRVDVYRRINAEQIVSLFQNSKIAILSSSTICTEAICIGCPVIAGYYIDNQVEYYQSLASKSLITPIGNLLELDTTALLQAIKNVTSDATPLNINFNDQRIRIINIFKEI